VKRALFVLLLASICGAAYAQTVWQNAIGYMALASGTTGVLVLSAVTFGAITPLALAGAISVGLHSGFLAIHQDGQQNFTASPSAGGFAPKLTVRFVGSVPSVTPSGWSGAEVPPAEILVTASDAYKSSKGTVTHNHQGIAKHSNESVAEWLSKINSNSAAVISLCGAGTYGVNVIGAEFTNTLVPGSTLQKKAAVVCGGAADAIRGNVSGLAATCDFGAGTCPDSAGRPAVPLAPYAACPPGWSANTSGGSLSANCVSANSPTFAARPNDGQVDIIYNTRTGRFTVDSREVETAENIRVSDDGQLLHIKSTDGTVTAKKQTDGTFEVRQYDHSDDTYREVIVDATSGLVSDETSGNEGTPPAQPAANILSYGAGTTNPGGVGQGVGSLSGADPGPGSGDGSGSGTGTGSCGGAGQSPCEIKWGGNSTAPGDPTARTGTQIGAAIKTSYFDGVLGWTVPSHTGECPQPSFEIFGETYTMQSHCTLFEANRAAIGAAFQVLFALMALFIVLGA